MAKSVLDAGWADLKHQLSYQAMTPDGSVLQVSQAYSWKNLFAVRLAARFEAERYRRLVFRESGHATIAARER